MKEPKKLRRGLERNENSRHRVLQHSRQGGEGAQGGNCLNLLGKRGVPVKKGKTRGNFNPKKTKDWLKKRGTQKGRKVGGGGPRERLTPEQSMGKECHRHSKKGLKKSMGGSS